MLATPTSVPDPTKGSHRSRVAILKTDSLAAPPKTFDAEPRIVSNHSRAPVFAPDGSSVVYPIGGENNVDNLWMQSLDGQPSRQITRFSFELIFGFGWSPDAKQLFVGRGHIESDAVLLRDTAGTK